MNFRKYGSMVFCPFLTFCLFQEHRVQRLFLVSLLLICVSGAIGCSKSQTMKDSWKFTTRQYRTYLNTPATLDLEDKGSCEPYELALGEAVLAVDSELQKLIRAMENSDHNPDQAWALSMMSRFPWLSGVALVEGSGKLVARYPELYAKTFDAQPLLEPDPKQRMGALRAYVQKSDAGPEIYLANPVFGGGEMRGLIVVYFDPKSLITISPDPGSFAMASPAGIVWPGAFGEGSVVAQENWETLLKQKSCGLIGPKGSDFFWTTRYLGNLPLVYAVPTSAGKSRQADSEPPAKAEPAPKAEDETKTPGSGTDARPAE